MADSYDAAGRPLSQTQNFLYNNAWKPFTVTRSYDVAGNVLSQTYPSGRTTTYAYAQSGRMTTFSGTLGDGASRTYASNLTYTAAGLLTKEQFGTTTTLWHRMNYNVRQQLYAVRLGTDGNAPADNDPLNAYYNYPQSWNRGLLVWHYGSTGTTNDFTSWGTSGTNNNGNVLRGHYWIPCGDNGPACALTYQDYLYDGLNRLTKVTEYDGGGGTNYVQAFSYDRWGNRQIDAGQTTDTINEKQFQLLTATNRYKATSDTNDGNENNDQMRYDAAGQLIWDSWTNPSNAARDFGYNNNGKIGRVKDSAGTLLARYDYDADGQRVRRVINSVETWQVYGMGGELLAEYAPSASQSSPQKEYGYRGGEMLIHAESSSLKYAVTDHLGTPRILVAQSGALSSVERHDYLPFGEEVPGSFRSTGYGYNNNSSLRQEFTGYERDDETGLDYAQARFFSSVQGRFTSPDPLNSSGTSVEPQSWNRYSYVGNRPTTITDPSGLIWARRKVEGGWQYGWFQNEEEYRAAINDPNSGWVEVDWLHPDETFYANGSDGQVWALHPDGTYNPTGVNANAPANMMPEQAFSWGIGAVGGRIAASLSRTVFAELLGDIPLTLGLSTGTRAATTGASEAAGGLILNLGSGQNPMAGAINVDKVAGAGVNVLAEAEAMPFATSTFSQVHAINPYGFNPVTAETARIMQPGAQLSTLSKAIRDYGTTDKPANPASNENIMPDFFCTSTYLLLEQLEIIGQLLSPKRLQEPQGSELLVADLCIQRTFLVFNEAV